VGAQSDIHSKPEMNEWNENARFVFLLQPHSVLVGWCYLNE